VCERRSAVSAGDRPSTLRKQGQHADRKPVGDRPLGVRVPDGLFRPLVSGSAEKLPRARRRHEQRRVFFAAQPSAGNRVHERRQDRSGL